MPGDLPRLYAIVDVDLCDQRHVTPLAVAEGYLAAGVRLLQVRAKHAAGRDLLELVDAVMAVARHTGAGVVVDDRVDIAAAAGAGVHVGQHDLPVAVARRLLGAGALVGRSTHDPRQLAVALAEPVSYVAFGPIFATATKADPDPVVGLDGLREAGRLAGAAGIPLVAIGGITLDSAPAVLAAGADAVAVIGDLLGDGAAPEARARRFLVALDGSAV